MSVHLCLTVGLGHAGMVVWRGTEDQRFTAKLLVAKVSFLIFVWPEGMDNQNEHKHG